MKATRADAAGKKRQRAMELAAAGKEAPPSPSYSRQQFTRSQQLKSNAGVPVTASGYSGPEVAAAVRGKGVVSVKAKSTAPKSNHIGATLLQGTKEKQHQQKAIVVSKTRDNWGKKNGQGSSTKTIDGSTRTSQRTASSRQKYIDTQSKGMTEGTSAGKYSPLYGSDSDDTEYGGQDEVLEASTAGSLSSSIASAALNSKGLVSLDPESRKQLVNELLAALNMSGGLSRPNGVRNTSTVGNPFHRNGGDNSLLLAPMPGFGGTGPKEEDRVLSPNTAGRRSSLRLSIAKYNVNNAEAPAGYETEMDNQNGLALNAIEEFQDARTEHIPQSQIPYGEREEMRRRSIRNKSMKAKKRGFGSVLGVFRGETTHADVVSESTEASSVETSSQYGTGSQQTHQSSKRRTSRFDIIPGALKRVASGWMPNLGDSNKSALVTPLDNIDREGVEASDSVHSVLDDIEKIKRMQQQKEKIRHEKYLASEALVPAKQSQPLGDTPTLGIPPCDDDQAKVGLIKAHAEAPNEIQLKKLYPELWESFSRYDKDNSGTIDTNELVDYLRLELNHTNISDEDIKTFFEEVDTDGDGGVSFEELGVWYHSVVASLDLGEASRAQDVTVGHLFNFARFNIKGPRNLVSSRNTRDKSLENDALDEFESAEVPGPLVIHPHSTPHIVWDIFVSSILVITVITLPLTMAFEQLNERMFVFNLIVDSVFCLDVCKHFFTGYEDSDGVPRLGQWRIFKHYLLGWFIPDLVSSVPIDLIIENIESGSDGGGSLGDVGKAAKSIKLIKLIRMAKLFRLLRVGRAYKYFVEWRRVVEDRLKIRVHESTNKMMKLLVLLLLLAHWIGCMQFLVCRIMDFPTSSWVVMSDIQDKPVGTQYMWVFYKALGQMIGVGYETPPITNLSCVDLNDDWCTIEMWITLLSMYIGSLFYAIMISNISSIIFSLNFASRLYQEKTQQLNEYMRSKNLPSLLRNRVRDYYQLRYSEGKIFNEDAIMHDLSPALRREIMIFTSRELFLQVPFFRDSGNGFISSLATNLKPMVAFQNDIIIEEGTTGDCMYFISDGQVEIFVETVDSGTPASRRSSRRGNAPPSSRQGGNKAGSPGSGGTRKTMFGRGPSMPSFGVLKANDDAEYESGSQTTIIAKIFEGCFFGEVAMVLPVRRTASARALTITIIYALERESLLLSLKDFPEIFQRLREVATSRVRRITNRMKNAKSPSNGSMLLDRDTQDIQAAALRGRGGRRKVYKRKM